MATPKPAISVRGLIQVLPYLYIGTADVATNKEVLQEQGIETIINCSNEDVDNFFPEDFKYVEFHIENDHTAEASEHFETAFKALKQVKEDKSCALVHCTDMKCVSPTIVLAYMMMASSRAHKYLPLNKATAFLQKKEPGCMPSRNDRLLQQLIDLEAELYDGETTMRVERRGRGTGKGRGGKGRGKGRRGK